MSTHSVVEVYLGNPITVASETQFLARLRHDLLRLGVSARILANLQVGRDDRQIDFVVVTDHRVVQIEEKTISGPVVAGPRNGPWKVRIGAADVRERGNPVRQALEATYALSDELATFAQAKPAPGPRSDKFFRDIDTVVCAFPALPDGSRFDPHRHVSVLGYDALLERLQERGPSFAWSAEDWDAFGRQLNLYREDEDSQEGVVRRLGTAAVDEYRGRFLYGRADLPRLVPTPVRVSGRPAPRPDLASELAAGRGVLVHGPSEFGKTLWAQAAAVALARAGHVPIWLAADMCDDSFRTSTARAIAPYTSLSPNELLKAAHAAGRAVVFVLDDPNKAAKRIRKALLAGAQTARVRDPGYGLLITAQTTDVASSVPDCLHIELTVLDDPDRQAVLAAYGAPDVIDCCDGFVSPLELSLAAACANELSPDASATELLDRHIDRVVGGDERLRSSLRFIARRMNTELRPSLPRPDVARTLRRHHGLTDEELHAVFTCPLVTVAQGRVAFRHERFERFLAAEALLLEAPDARALARALNAPACANMRQDVVALETSEDRVSEILAGCEHPEVLVAAATGQLGSVAARVSDAVLTETLNVAFAQTCASDIQFQPGTPLMFDGRWTSPTTTGPAGEAHLAAIGRLLRRGRFVEDAARLLDRTDAVCAATLANADPTLRGLADQIFAATYVFRGPKGFPASALVTRRRCRRFPPTPTCPRPPTSRRRCCATATRDRASCTSPGISCTSRSPRRSWQT